MEALDFGIQNDITYINKTHIDSKPSTNAAAHEYSGSQWQDLCFGVLALILCCLGSSVKSEGIGGLTSSHHRRWFTVHWLASFPKALGQDSSLSSPCHGNVCKWKTLAGFGVIFFPAVSSCPINSMLMQSRRYFVSPPQPAAKQSNTFKILQNSFHFKVLIQGLAVLHYPVFWLPPSGCLESYSLQKRILSFCFFTGSHRKPVCWGGSWKNAMLSSLKRTKRIWMDFNSYFVLPLLQSENSASEVLRKLIRVCSASASEGYDSLRIAILEEQTAYLSLSLRENHLWNVSPSSSYSTRFLLPSNYQPGRWFVITWLSIT